MVEWRNFEIIYLFIYFYLFYFVGLEYLIKKPKCSPECSRGAMGLLVQMAVPGELFLTIFSVCLPLFENERANMGVIHEPDVELIFTSYHNVCCLSTCKQM